MAAPAGNECGSAPTQEGLAAVSAHFQSQPPILIVNPTPVRGAEKSDPLGHLAIDSSMELRRVDQVLREARLRAALLLPPTLEALKARLTTRVQLVHLVSHTAGPEGPLMLEGGAGQRREVRPSQLASAFRTRNVPLVLLGCCWGEQLAVELVESWGARAVFYGEGTLDSEAAFLATEVYHVLSRGGTAGEALESARRQVEGAYASWEIAGGEDLGRTRALRLRLHGSPHARLSLDISPAGPFGIDWRRPPGNLPAPPAIFAGRGAELVRVSECLEQREPIAVIGIPGIGKTAFALQAAERNRWRFERMVHVNLRGAADPVRLLCETLTDQGSSAGTRSRVSRGNLVKQAVATLSEGPTLVLLEDVDGLASGSGLPELLRRVPPENGSRLLLTARSETPAMQELGVVHHVRLRSLDPEEATLLLVGLLQKHRAWSKLPAAEPPLHEARFDALGIPPMVASALDELIEGSRRLPFLIQHAARDLGRAHRSFRDVADRLADLRGLMAGETPFAWVGRQVEELVVDHPDAGLLLGAVATVGGSANREETESMWRHPGSPVQRPEPRGFGEAASAACSAGLLEFDAAGGRCEIHPLIHDYLRQTRPDLMTPWQSIAAGARRRTRFFQSVLGGLVAPSPSGALEVVVHSSSVVSHHGVDVLGEAPSRYPEGLLQEYDELTCRKWLGTLTDAEASRLQEVRDEIDAIDQSDPRAYQWRERCEEIENELAAIGREIETLSNR